MSRRVTPIADLANGRPQEAGKLKTGRFRKGSRFPEALSTWRFVSSDIEAIEGLAELYGGEFTVHDGKADLVSEASRIEVLLPPDPLHGTPIYEAWSGGGCLRRCDGETASVPVATGDVIDHVDVPCVCLQEGERMCEPTTRLSVILPQVTLGGVWNLRTNSWNAAREMQQMVGLIEAAQQRGLAAAVLAIESREKVELGKKKKFKVPILRLNATISDLMGETQVALPSAVEPAPALMPGFRDRLNTAWKAADAASRAEAQAWMDERGLTAATITAQDSSDLLDILVVLEPDEF